VKATKGIMTEIAATLLSIDGPYIDISDEEKLFEQSMLLHNNADEPDESFPMVFAYVDSENTELVANNRFEISSNIDISVIYKIDPKEESVTDGVQRGRDCLMQIYNRLIKRQTTGEALLAIYPSGGIEIDVTSDYGIDHDDTDLVNGAATAKFTLKQIQQPQETNHA